MGDCRVDVGYSFGVIEIFWKLLELVVMQHCNILNAAELNTLKQLILYCVSPQ